MQSSRQLSAASSAEFAEHGERRFIAAGTLLCRQGCRQSTTYLLCSGLVRAFYDSPQGKTFTLGYWSPVDLLGGPDYFGRVAHIWSVEAVEDSVVYAIEGERLRQLVREVPDLAEFVLDDLTYEAHWLSALIQILATESAGDRLAHVLVKLAELHGEPTARGVALKHRFSHEQLASMVGASRQWVCPTLNRLERAGLLAVDNGRIELLDIAALRELGHAACVDDASGSRAAG